MLALYRSGRQAEALQVYQDARRMLVEELGIEPSQALQRLEQSILTHDPAIEPPVSEQPRPAARGARSGSRRWPAVLRNRRLLVAVLAAAAAVAVSRLRSSPGAITPLRRRPSRECGRDHRSRLGSGHGPGRGRRRAGRARPWQTAACGLRTPSIRACPAIDLASRQGHRDIAVGGVPISLAVGRNAVWVVRQPGRRLSRADQDRPALRRRAAGRRSPAGRPASAASVATSRDGIWVAAEEGSCSVSILRGSQVTASIDTGNNPSSLAVGAGRCGPSDALGNTVARIDPASNLVIATTRVGNGPASVATSAAAVWVAERLDDAVGRIDPETNSVTTTIPVGRSPTGIAVGFGSVWVANSLDGTVSRIDPARNRVTATIPVGGSPTAISVGNGRVWVSVRTALVAASGKRGDVVRVASTPIDYVDPAIADSLGSWQLEYVTCAGLLNYPDRPAPEGSRLVPEVAAAMPTRSADGKSYTFTVRPGFRFSPPSNAPVTAQTFKYAIERALSPKVEDGPGRNFVGDIVGARAYETGKAKHISGISVRGNTLTVRLTDIAPDILARLIADLFLPCPTRHARRSRRQEHRALGGAVLRRLVRA